MSRDWIQRATGANGSLCPVKLGKMFASSVLVFEAYETKDTRGVVVRVDPARPDGAGMLEIRRGDMRRLGFNVRRLAGAPARLVVTP